ncbi:MAG: Na+/H+ antiporter subunit E [Woeseiaceae bacterium]|nr:Na+/H+ antiporter subunit E [Woeseiaceae bacterium]
MSQRHDTAAGPSSAGSARGRLLILALMLAAAWLLWSGLYKPLLLGLGLLSCLLTLHVVRRMGYFDNDLFAFGYGFRLFGFWGWLTREIVRSSLEVARVVLRPSLALAPRVVKLDASALGPVDQALLGNSITLTPGTLTLDVHEDRLLVHALTPEGAAELEQGEMYRRVAALRAD